MSKLQTELEKVRRQTEDKCKEQYKDEMKKLAQKHKETISSTKKKQWVGVFSNILAYWLNFFACENVSLVCTNLLEWKCD